MFISQKAFLEMQSALNKFVWAAQQSRFKVRKMYLPIEKRGLVVSDIKRYYEASQMTTMLQWWRKDREVYWGMSN